MRRRGAWQPARRPATPQLRASACLVGWVAVVAIHFSIVATQAVDACSMGLGLGCPWPCFSCQLRQPCAKARVSFLAVACSPLLKPLALPTAGEAAAVRPHSGQVVSSALLQSHTTSAWEPSALYITASTCRTGLGTLGLTAAGGAAAVRPHSGQVMSSALLQSHAASVWEPPALYHHCNHLQDWDGSPWPCCSRWSSCSQIAVSIFDWPCCSRWSSYSQVAVLVILALLQQA